MASSGQQRNCCMFDQPTTDLMKYVTCGQSTLMTSDLGTLVLGLGVLPGPASLCFFCFFARRQQDRSILSHDQAVCRVRPSQPALALQTPVRVDQEATGKQSSSRG